MTPLQTAGGVLVVLAVVWLILGSLYEWKHR